MENFPPPPLPFLSILPPPPPLPSPHLLRVKRVTNPENQNNTNDHENPKNHGSQEDGSTLTSQSQNGSSSLRSNDDFVVDEELFENSTKQQAPDENPKIEPSRVYEEASQGNDNTTQQSRVGNSGIKPSHVYNQPPQGNIMNQPSPLGNFGVIGPSHTHDDHESILTQEDPVVWKPSCFYNILPFVSNPSYRPARVGNFGPIGPSRGHVRKLDNGNNTNQQNLVGNSGFAPYRPLGNNTNEPALVENLGIEPSSISNSSSLMRRRCDNVTWSLEVYRGRLVSMSKDEYGSNYLETILENKDPQDIKFILRELMGDLHDLMKDIFGKNVIEKIFDVLDCYPLTLFFEVITMNTFEFLDVCENNIGYKVVMSMIDHLTTEVQRKVLTFTLKEISVSLATSQYGSDVLQHFLRICPNDFLEDILPEMAFECCYIATTRIGSSLLQKCLYFATPDKISCLFFFHEVANIVLILANHQYGNYVVQCLIRMGLHEINDTIVNQLRGHYVEFSANQHASNVVERLLQFSSQKNVEIIVQEILNSSAFLSVLKDPFGNYVAQTALECSQGDIHKTLVKKILKNDQILRIDRYGRKVLDFVYGGGTLLLPLF